MANQPTAGCSYIKSERMEGSAPKTDLVQGINGREANDSDEVSPSAIDETTPNPWLQVKCIFCGKFNLRFGNAKLLDCLHTACLNCINSRLSIPAEDRKALIECNTCHIQSKSLHDNPFLMVDVLLTSEQSNNDTSRIANMKCTSCHDSLVATSWCVNCNDYLCDGCVQAHQRLKITKDHTVKSKEEAELENNLLGAMDSKGRVVSCPLHPQEKLSLYCETCEVLTCRDCQLTEHKLHSYKFIDEIAAETKNTIKILLNEVNYKRMLLKSAMKVIDDRQQMIVDKKKELLNDITQMVVKLTDAITTRGKHLVNRLNEICDSKQKTMKEKKVALEHLSLLTDHCIEFISNALSRGSGAAVLKTKTTILNHLQLVKSKRADIPNPEIPVRIQLALEKANEACQMISRLGVIIVDGRQYGTYNSHNSHQNQPSIVGPYSAVPQQQYSKTTFVAPPPGYNNMGNNSMFNNMNNNMARAPPVHMNVHNIRGMRPQYTNVNTNLNMHFNVVPNNNNQMRNVGLTGYQQQVTSSTHPQNTVYSNMPGSNFDQSLRKLLCDKQNANMASGNAQNIRSVTPTMQHGISYQNGDHISNSRVQSVSPQSGIKVQYSPSPSMTKMYPSYQSNLMQSMMGSGQSGRSNMVSPGARHILSRENSLSPLPQQQVQWHTPQINNVNMNKQQPSLSDYSNYRVSNDESYKITLPCARSRPSITPPASGASVSSSVSQTPSPLNQTKLLPEETEKKLDKVGQDSVNDLMATIARLDSNGIKVIPEIRRKPGDSPLVDSSTGPSPIHQLLNGHSNNSNSDNTTSVSAEPQKGCDDPNEDWCAVCMDGGELVCCDNCPKVFHINCHIPPLATLPGENDSWQCLLCTNIMECVNAVSAGNEEISPEGSLTPKTRKIVERMLLELYCQYDPSVHFRETVNAEIVDYYEKIKKPMSLDIIRKRLLRTSENPYKSLREFIDDIRLIFQNAYIYNEEGSQIYSDAKNLEEFFDQMLDKWLPGSAYDDTLRLSEAETEDEATDGPPSKRCKKSASD